MRLLPLLLLAAAAAAPAVAAAQAGADSDLASWVTSFSTQIGREEGGIRLTAVRAEGHTLILEVNLLPAVPSAFTAEAVVSITAGGMCSDPVGGAFFTSGHTLRMEVSRDGRPVGMAATDHCPGPVGQGLSAETFATAMQPLVGRQMEAGLTITGVRAEGRILVVTMDAPAGWRRNAGAGAMENAFLTGFCEGDTPSDSIFKDGLGLRVDTTEAGRNLSQGRIVTACPQH